MKRYAIGAALGMILMFGTMKACEGPRPGPLKYTEFITDTIVGEPDTIVQWRERIVYREIQPDYVAEQPGGAENAAEEFCHPDTVRITETKTDTVRVSVPTPWLARSVVTDPAWFFGKDKVTIYGFDGTGTRRELQFHARPGWRFTLGRDQLIQQPRLGIFHQAIEFTVPLVAGYLIGALVK